MRIGDYHLVKEVYALSEKYAVYNDSGDEVGFLHLRHGVFNAYVGEDTVHTSHPDGWATFTSSERDYHLENGIIAIANYYREG